MGQSSVMLNGIILRRFALYLVVVLKYIFCLRPGWLITLLTNRDKSWPPWYAPTVINFIKRQTKGVAVCVLLHEHKTLCLLWLFFSVLSRETFDTFVKRRPMGRKFWYCYRYFSKWSSRWCFRNELLPYCPADYDLVFWAYWCFVVLLKLYERRILHWRLRYFHTISRW